MISASPGFHPWFAHWISTAPHPPPKDEHYRSLFLSIDEQFGEGTDSTNASLRAFEEMLPSLPEPLSIGECISSLRQNFESFPRAMLGEVGLDRSARVPYDHRAEHRKLSPFTVPFDHQLILLEAQLAVAVEMGRNVSMHR